MPIYIGTFIIAFATLALQVALTRMLSITTWYYVAFFAIGTAMLGMTIGAVRVYCAPEKFARPHLHRNLMLGSIGFALCTLITLLTLCFLPVNLEILTIKRLTALSLLTFACLLPYYFAGIVVTLVLTRCDQPVSRVYAADLLGASLGCLFVIGMMEVSDPTSLVLICAGVGALSASAYVWNFNRRWAMRCLLLPAILFICGAINTQSTKFLRPFVVKGRYQPTAEFVFERSNSFSHVLGHHAHDTDRPQLWGPSPKTPLFHTSHFGMVIDGDAGTIARRFKDLADLEHLRYDVTNAAYQLRPTGGACIIGVGGGRDLQSALLFGHQDILGIDVNPIFIDLIENEYRDYVNLADRPEIRLQVDDARGYLSHSSETFAVLQMSLIDTWAATGAGAFSLSENTLYTVEAWNTFLNRLKPDGIFTVSRWYNPHDLGETSRLMSLAVGTLLDRGVKNPSEHLALIGAKRIATLLVSAKPFSAEEIQILRDYCQEYEFQPILLPGTEIEHPLLKQILQIQKPEEFAALTRGHQLQLEPPTDESPYFFNMLNLQSILKGVTIADTGVIGGNLRASKMLGSLILVLLVATFLTVLVPLWIRPGRTAAGDSAPILLSGAIYFSLIGAGFMLCEIALIQRLSVLLSHPTYALGILLFTLILSTGVGSFLSERLPLTRAPWVYLYPLLVAAMILITSEAVRYVLREFITSDLTTKIGVSLAVIFPLGVTLGLCFPTGMRLVRAARPGETPWYWALNGVFGVLCSTIAVGISIFGWISLNFYLAAACYVIVAFATAKIYSHAKADSPTGVPAVAPAGN